MIVKPLPPLPPISWSRRLSLLQVQIRYTRPDGMKCMRVLTKTQRVTKSKVEAEKSMSVRPAVHTWGGVTVVVARTIRKYEVGIYSHLLVAFCIMFRSVSC